MEAGSSATWFCHPAGAWKGPACAWAPVPQAGRNRQQPRRSHPPGCRAQCAPARKDVLEVELVVSISPRQAAGRARQVIGQYGRVLNSEDPGDASGAQVIGIMGSGAANLNPAVVTMTIEASEWGSRLVIRGAAKEGLIKQRAGAKAATRVAVAIAPEVADPQAG